MPDEIETLKQNARRWKRTAIISWVVLALVVMTAASTLVIQTQRARAAARAAEKAAREAEEAAKRRSEEVERLQDEKLQEISARLWGHLGSQLPVPGLEELNEPEPKKAREWLKKALDK